MSASGRVPVRDTSREVQGHDPSETYLIPYDVEPKQSIIAYLQLFWANRRLLLRAGMYAILASVALAIIIPARYQSVTELMPPDDQSGSGLGILASMAGQNGNLGRLQGLAGDLLGMKTSGDLFIGILNSETAKDKLIEEFQLKKVYHDSKIEDARKDLTKHTGISEDSKSGIISIAVTDHDPKRAAALAQAYVAELNLLVAQLSTSSARRERIFLEARLERVRNNLEIAEKNFSDFASKNTAIDIPAQGKAMVDAAATLQGQLIAAQAELSGLQQIYTRNNARVRAAQARVNELQKKLEEIGGAGTQADLEKSGSLYPSIRKLPLLGVQYADLYRQTKVEEAVYEFLTQQYESAKIQEAKEIPSVRVLDPAMVPTKTSFPPRTVIVVLGTMLGITLAMTWIVGKTRWEELDAGDPRKMFAAEVLQTLREHVARFSKNGAKRESSNEQSISGKDRY